MRGKKWKKWVTLAAVTGMLVSQMGTVPAWAMEEQNDDVVTEAVEELTTEEETESEEMLESAVEVTEVMETEETEEDNSTEDYNTVSGNDAVTEDNAALIEDTEAFQETAAVLPEESNVSVTSEDVVVKENGSGTYVPYEGAKYSLRYSVTDEGVSITGISDYESKEDLGQLVIPEKIEGVAVTTIGESAFDGCSGFTGNLIIPNSVTTIEWSAFYGCSGFTGDLVIPESVTTIESFAFGGCSGFTGNLVISKGVTTIGSNAFKRCSGFTGDLVIPESVTTIGSNAFDGCSGFTGDLVIPESVTTIGSYAFYGCSGFTGNLVISKGVTTIGSNAFYGCSGFTGDLVISKGVTTIESYAFYGCSGFTGDLVIPESVTTIERDAFYNCNFQNLIIGMKNIPESTFYGYDIEGTLTLMEGVEIIGKSAFAESNFTGDLVIPSSVKTIGRLAFMDCNFENLIIGMEDIPDGYDGAFERCNFSGTLTLLEGVKTIGNSSFKSCSLCKGDLIIPDGVVSIGLSAFENCENLSFVKIPDSVQQIGAYAFYGCLNLSAEIAEGVQQIGVNAFASWGGISKITVYGDTTEIEDGGLGEYKFIYGYSGSTAETYAKNRSCTFILLDETPEVTEYRVSTTQELLDAIGSYGEGSYRHIILEDGVYELSNRIYLSHVASLTLEAENPGKAEILSSNRDIPVVIINGCTDIKIIGCILGHDAVEPSSCGTGGYVFKMENSFDVNIEKCDLYGCGVEGVHCSGVRDVNLNNCIIRDCMEDVSSGGGGLSFTNCIISGNAYDEVSAENHAAFNFIGNISTENCLFMNNYNTRFSRELYGDEPIEIMVENCAFYDNAWDGKTPKAYGICLNGITWQVDGDVLKIGYPLVLENTTIPSEKGAVLPYSDSSLPWKDYQNLKINVAEGVTYGSLVVPDPAKFTVVGTIGGRNVTFSTATEDAVIYYSSKTSNLTTEDACVQNGETVLFENFYGTVYARAYANGQWSNVSRLILKIPVVSKPVITSSNGTVTIKTSTPNSTIYYTTDGSTPSPTNGKRLTNSAGSFTVPANCTVKAIAVRSCFTNSEIASAAVTVKKLGAPSFDVKGVIGGRAVTFNTTETQGEIYYSFTTSNITTKDLHVKPGETVLFENYYGTVYAKTYVNGQWSNVSRLILKIPVVNKPTITAAGNGKVKISTSTPNCTIYYTTDGSTPSPTHGTRINSSSSIVTVGSGKTVKAIAVRSCFTNSQVVTYQK